MLEDGKAVRLGGRALDILTALVVRSGTLISKEELISYAWPRVRVEEANLRSGTAPCAGRSVKTERAFDTSPPSPDAGIVLLPPSNVKTRRRSPRRRLEKVPQPCRCRSHG